MKTRGWYVFHLTEYTAMWCPSYVSRYWPEYLGGSTKEGGWGWGWGYAEEGCEALAYNHAAKKKERERSHTYISHKYTYSYTYSYTRQPLLRIVLTQPIAVCV